MIRIQEILDKVAANNHDANLELIQKAYVFAATAHAGQTRLSGEPYLSHPLAVAYTLADMGFDEPTVAAGLLHDTVEDTGTTIEEIDDKFGEDVADIVDGVTKISMIVFENKEEAQAENIRMMILAMSHDMRVLMVKLADRLHNMSTLDFQKPHKQRRIAQETMDIYAPLANRLGLYLLKRQLEDLSFKYLRPDIYNQIDHWLDAHQVVEKQIIEKVVSLIQDLLASNGLEGQVYGRIKHKYSIYKKMQSQSLTLDEMHDIMAFRVLVKELQSLALDIKVLNEDHEEIGIRELIEDERDEFDEHAEKQKHYSGEEMHFDDKDIDVSHNLFDEDLDDDDAEGGESGDLTDDSFNFDELFKNDDIVIDDTVSDDDDLSDYDDDKSDDDL